MKFLKQKFSLPVSPFMMVGVLVVLLPVFTFMTLDRMERHDDHIRERFLVRGISLIRTFEAGTRTGMLTMGWGGQRIQAMLQETAVQDDIAYIMITDERGQILAHSDPERIGSTYTGFPVMTEMTREKHRVFNRTRQMEGVPVFEVYKRFAPMEIGPWGRHKGRHGRHRGDTPPSDFFNAETQYIFAGLSMARTEEIKGRMTRMIIGRGVFFFLLGCAGIIALIAFQAYRSAKVSLERVTAFTDNVVQNMPSGLITLDTEYTVTSANRAAGDILGPLPEKAYPEMIRLAVEMGETKAVITRELMLRRMGAVNVISGKHPDSKANPKANMISGLRLDMTASPLLDDEKKIQGYIFLFRDLTQLDALKKEVETNRRLAAIGKLAGGVAHEIRNPLSSIKGFATYFAKRYENEPDDADTAKIMVEEVERINRSITQLLEFAKPMAVESRPVEIEPLISHSLKLVAHDLEKKGIDTNISINTRFARLRTDPDRINQVLLNLYMNAINAMTAPGMLSVAVGDTEDRVEIRVRDTGTGIEPDHIEDIFDPYFTTRPDGTGLGLSIVHRIIENLKGEIRVESEPGKGSCFIIRLPAQGTGGKRETQDTP
ncbi:MAG TPA: histidine kinase [Desulfobacteraceae bacterium]|nr:histidine kinase [Desulfobacteraceae bacterium]